MKNVHYLTMSNPLQRFLMNKKQCLLPMIIIVFLSHGCMTASEPKSPKSPQTPVMCYAPFIRGHGNRKYQLHRILKDDLGESVKTSKMNEFGLIASYVCPLSPEKFGKNCHLTAKLYNKNRVVCHIVREGYKKPTDPNLFVFVKQIAQKKESAQL